ncbi:MAG: hypothetical protein Q7S33_02055 [Nanoarchaeota archaeon]|nr:hypothetical protein [Nanoarchaeota archaeon]
MAEIKQNENMPYFFLISNKYTLGTPRGIAISERTIDILFHDLAHNYKLQTKLNLASAMLFGRGIDLVSHTASYLAAFANNPNEEGQRRDYLVNNGIVRILVKDDILRDEVRKAI